MIQVTFTFNTIAEAAVALASLSGPTTLRASAAEQAKNVDQMRDTVDPTVTGKSTTAPTAPAPARGPRTAAAAAAGAPEKTGAASSPSAANAAAAPPASTAAGEGFDYEVLRQAVFTLAKKSRDAAVEVASSFGVKTMKELPADRWAEAFAAVNAKLEELQ